jgi:hypothetical protein
MSTVSEPIRVSAATREKALAANSATESAATLTRTTTLPAAPAGTTWQTILQNIGAPGFNTSLQPQPPVNAELPQPANTWLVGEVGAFTAAIVAASPQCFQAVP